jgi:carboxyl-terminal processing protease
MAPRTRRALFSVTLFLATCAIVGSLISEKVAAQSASDESALRDSLRQFTDVYSIVEQNYAQPLDQDKIDKAIYDGAIPGMLHVLDPHSNFYDPKAFAQMREDQHGNYYGVGMSIQPQPDKNGIVHVVVLTPFEGTPAFKAGIRPGDVIVSIDGKPAPGDSAEVASMLKGPKGTHVSVVMAREGKDQPLTFDLVRDEIPHPSVDFSFLIKPGIGYVHILNFSSETTGREFSDALEKFQAANGDLRGLVIDLRGNPGGLLNEAVDVSDKLLQKGQVVVSQRGRAFPEQVYKATHGEDGTYKYPIVVVVNRNTASAAEIVSGALQDHDRALIVGETTFGKGLVQTVFQISENTGLALTTYHYYTPSGRLIQRPYDHLSLYDYFYVRNDAKKPDQSNLEVKLTDSGRTVYGGGGITPDEKIDVPDMNRFQESLYQQYIFVSAGFSSGVGNFSKHYLATHTVSRDFVVDDQIVQQFKEFLKANQVDFTDADVANNLDWIKSTIKTELFTSQFGQLEGLKVHAESDPEITKALTFMPEALALEDRNKGPQNTASLAH